MVLQLFFGGWGQCIYLFLFKSHKRCVLSQYSQQHCYICFPKNLTPWWDSNPGLLFLRQMRWPLHRKGTFWVKWLSGMSHIDFMFTYVHTFAQREHKVRVQQFRDMIWFIFRCLWKWEKSFYPKTIMAKLKRSSSAEHEDCVGYSVSAFTSTLFVNVNLKITFTVFQYNPKLLELCACFPIH
jgi:hypothetical protein